MHTVVNAPAAEAALLDLVGHVLYSEGMVDDIIRRVEHKLREARGQSSEDRVRALEQRLVRLDAEMERLVDALAAGVLVDAVQKKAKELELARAHVREQLTAATEESPLPPLRSLPEIVRRSVGNLRALLAAGEVGKTKHWLTSLVSRIEVESQSRQRKRGAGSTLVVWPKIEGAVGLLEAEFARNSSPGGLWPLLRASAPRLMQIDLRGHRGWAGGSVLPAVPVAIVKR